MKPTIRGGMDVLPQIKQAINQSKSRSIKMEATQNNTNNTNNSANAGAQAQGAAQPQSSANEDIRKAQIAKLQAEAQSVKVGMYTNVAVGVALVGCGAVYMINNNPWAAKGTPAPAVM